jgi:hypothetical protein
MWLLCVALVAVSAPQPEAPEDLPGASPVALIPRVEVRHRFVEPETGGALHVTTLRMDIEALRRVLLRYHLPLAVLRTAQGETAGGLGDIHLDALTMITSGPRHLSVLITGLVLDTATRAPLGMGKQQAVLGAGAAAKPWPWWLLFAIVQEQFSYAGDDARPDINGLFIRAGSIFFGGRGDWYTLDMDSVTDFTADESRLLGSLETGRLLVGRVGLFVRAGTHLLGPRNVDYTVEAGVRYLFRLER